MAVGDYLRSTALYWLLFACWAVSASEVCEKGWFGPQCKYKCHCAGTACESDGSCPKCEGGWFGPECQYVDVAFKRQYAELATDGDDTTCYSPQKQRSETTVVDVYLDRPYPLTWLRVHVNNSELLHKLSFWFALSTQGVECVNQSNFTVDDKTLDLHCGSGKLFRRVLLTGEGVCSVYISGGRNVALKQVTWQSTTWSENTTNTGWKNVTFVASRAVDGDTSQDLYNSTSCSSTRQEDRAHSTATFVVAFSKPYMVYYFTVYLKSKERSERNYLFLSALDENNASVINPTNLGTSAPDVYTFTPKGKSVPISLVKIEPSRSSLYENILTLCEVQIFGDSVCNIGEFGRDCEHPCHCAGGTACSVNNGGCPSGCAPGFHGLSCNQRTATEASISVLPAVGAVVGVVLVMLLVLVTVIVLRRWKKTQSNENLVPIKMTSQESRVKTGSDSALVEVVMSAPTTAKYIPASPAAATKAGKKTEKKGDNGEAHVEYCNMAFERTTTALSIDELAGFIKSRDRAFFLNQFNNIPVNLSATMSVALSPENIHKNRYKNISAYDHSRVHLISNVDKRQEDYINASYIVDHISGQTFIASQGPSKLTLGDFVRMLWEKQVDKVVMLTNLVEQGKHKCEQYWPDDGEMNVGEITVHLATTQVFAEYIIRRLQLKKADEPARNLTQFHFTAWPDKDVPTGPWGLVDFEQRVACYPTQKPIVVHCSAGVGRTGTFIALRNLIRQAEDTGRVDFFTTVQKLRQDRVNMVQTVDQYIFLHKATFVAFICVGTIVTAKDIQNRNESFGTKSDQTKTDAEFKAICRAHDNLLQERSSDEDSHFGVEHNQNNQKNRFSSIVSYGLYSPTLQCENSGLGDYINAVLVPSFTKQGQQILTQLPLPGTTVDFWRLIAQYKVTLVVAFEADLKSTDPTVGDYLPAADNQPADFSVFKVWTEPVNTKTFWKQETVYLTVDKSQVNNVYVQNTLDEHKLTHLTCTTTDFDPGFVLSLLEQIRSLLSRHRGRILYTCRNGATYSGLLCVLSLLLDRMDNDQRLTVPLVVGAIKAVRPEVIPTVDQYRLLYQVLHLYSENMSEYSNFGS